MADCLNIRVATDLTDRQNTILREEKQSGNQAFFYKGRLCHNTLNERHGPFYRHQHNRRNYQHAADRHTRHPVRERDTMERADRARNQDRNTGNHMRMTSSEANGNYTHRSAGHEDHQTSPHRHGRRQQTSGEQDVPHPEGERPVREDRRHVTSEEHRPRQLVGDAEAAFVPRQAQHAHNTPPQHDKRSHQHHVSVTDDRVPTYYSVSAFPTLRRETTRTTPAKTPTQRIPQQQCAFTLRTTATTAAHEKDIAPNTSLPDPPTLTTGLDTLSKSPEQRTDDTPVDDPDGGRHAAECAGNQQPFGDVRTDAATPSAPESEHDLSQTFAKQLLDPWDAAEDARNTTTLSQEDQAQSSPPEDGLATNLTFEVDPESTPGGPLTRSKVKQRQTQLTDMFPTSASRPSRKEDNHPCTDNSPI